MRNVKGLPPPGGRRPLPRPPSLLPQSSDILRRTSLQGPVIRCPAERGAGKRFQGQGQELPSAEEGAGAEDSAGPPQKPSSFPAAGAGGCGAGPGDGEGEGGGGRARGRRSHRTSLPPGPAAGSHPPGSSTTCRIVSPHRAIVGGPPDRRRLGRGEVGLHLPRELAARRPRARRRGGRRRPPPRPGPAGRAGMATAGRSTTRSWAGPHRAGGTGWRPGQGAVTAKAKGGAPGRAVVGRHQARGVAGGGRRRVAPFAPRVLRVLAFCSRHAGPCARGRVLRAS